MVWRVRFPNVLAVRRTFVVGLMLVTLLTGAFPTANAPKTDRNASPALRFKAVAFDYFVLFNPDSVVPEVEQVFPGKGRDVTNLWRTRQFEYTWLRSITDRYVDFFAVTQDALVYAANSLKLELTPDNRHRLMDAYLHLAALARHDRLSATAEAIGRPRHHDRKLQPDDAFFEC